ncbi:MAG: methyltransferase [Anaeromyxobacteraceae bacterium]
MPAKRRTAAPKKPTTSRKPPAKRPAAARPGKKAPHGAKRDRHGNPTDFDAYLARLDDPGRAKWQLPERVVAALRLKKGGVAAEIGSGTGQFTIRMAKKVGEDGRVYAIDVEPRMLELLAERAAAAKAWGIVGLLAPDGGGLPPEPVDVVLMVNVFHHVHERADYLRALGTRLARGGRIAIVDFHERELPIGPPPDHKLAKADAIAAVEAAGLRVVREEKFLPYQYFLIVGA